jgi:hypothetical protein
MRMESDALIRSVELLWATEDYPGYGPREGFLWHYRNGDLHPDRATRALEVLRSIDPGEFGDSLPRDLVRLLWWIPFILSENRGRIAEGGADMAAVDKVVGAIEEELHRILGVP